MINQKIRSRALMLCATAVLFNSPAIFASSATSGSLVIYNGLANVSSATGIGYTASPIKVQVYDVSTSTAPCTTVNNVAYNGVIVVPWNANNTHASNVCSTIASVTITPLANPVLGTVIYGATTVLSASGSATGSVSYAVPTTLYSNMVLMPIGYTTAATSASATTWSNILGVAPTFNAGGGDLASAGVPGVSALNNFRARAFMLSQGIQPYQEHESSYSIQDDYRE